MKILLILILFALPIAALFVHVACLIPGKFSCNHFGGKHLSFWVTPYTAHNGKEFGRCRKCGRQDLKYCSAGSEWWPARKPKIHSASELTSITKPSGAQ